MPLCSSSGSRGSQGLPEAWLWAWTTCSRPVRVSLLRGPLKALTPTPTRLQRLPQRLGRFLRRRVSFCIACTSFGPPCSSSTMAQDRRSRPAPGPPARPSAGSSRGTGAAASSRAASCGLRGAYAHAQSPSWLSLRCRAVS